ncbi:hypothetical protein PPYR_13873 [Photinus pyralis]|uniref:Cytochrome P450 n=1 Tax=Photinus pyralis TaxID=7054 RepID=A0A5N4AAA6_PHOPY|nr:cytochrome P450 9e2-like [Photinus pyralis]KAB0794253.1 hypothetical protein PPYR_13873 [Photinus pyralis]
MLWLLLVFGLIIAIFLFITLKQFRYWSSKGVKQSSIFQLWVDNIKIIFQLVSPAEHTVELNKRFSSERFAGSCYYFQPLLLLRAPDMIKQIAIKDFENFIDRIQFLRDDIEPLWTKSIFLLRGDEWKAMRATLSPSFTSSKMKGMFGLIKECAENFVKFYEDRRSSAESVDVKDAFARYANDVIASAAFGVTCNSLEEPNNEFYLMGKQATDLSGFWKNISIIFVSFFPKLAKPLGLRLLPAKCDRFFRKVMKENMEDRERNGIIRPDMIHLLMEARKGKLKHDEGREVNTGFATIEESAIGKEEKLQNLHLTDEIITAQALIFFFAGFDSSSTLMSFLSYELAVNPDIQKRLHREVDDTLEQCNGSVTYEALFKMKYLDMVVSETLRKWPTITAIDRLCVKPYTIVPTKDGEEPVHLEEGDLVWFPMYALHRDPKYYPEPERFDPERFSDENKSKIVPYSYFPFGVGPRSCIGNRFALLETKLLFFILLSKFELTVVEKTDIPLPLCKKQFSLAASNGIWVGFHSRRKELD